MPPASVPTSNATKGGVFLMIIAMTITGTMNNHGLILNALPMASSLSETSAVPVVSKLKPMIRNTKRVTEIVGTVVNVIYRMCEKSSPPAMAGAKLVVSLKGDILSPKYAPEITAPAVIPSEMPSVSPMPIKAMPTVAEVVHELPVAMEIKAQMIMHAAKKMEGLRICNP